MQQPQTLAPGDIVQLVSGGPPMAVAKLEGPLVHCYWHASDGTLQREDIPRPALKLVHPPQTALAAGAGGSGMYR